MNARDKGRIAEQKAVEFLEARGFSIRDVNWQAGHKEVDIVAEKDGVLHVVEVRSLSSARIMQPYQSVSYKKQQNLIVAANAYLDEHSLDLEVQFDIVSIVHSQTSIDIEYIPKAFYPQL